MKTMKKHITECPFEFLPHQSEKIVQNWYKARAYVLHELNNLFNPSIPRPESLHFVVDGDSELTLSVVRHLALYSHFINFEEYDDWGNLSEKNRTTITIVSKKKAEDIEKELKKEEYLCNLPDHCLFSIYGKTKNVDSYLNLDIELEIVQNPDKEADIITEEKVLNWIGSQNPDDVFSIDTRKAIYANETYNLGARIDNIPYEDINSSKRYSKALQAFRHNV